MKPLKTGAGPRTVVLTGSSLTIGELVAVSRQDLPVDIGPESMEAVGRSRHLVDLWGRSGKVIYGVTTGFGEMVQWLIPPDCEKELQQNLIRSHAANVGDAFPREVVRAVLLLRLNCLSKGHSGVRVETVKTLLGMLNEKVHPQIPELGSVGASGDLSPWRTPPLWRAANGSPSTRGNSFPEARPSTGRGFASSTSATRKGWPSSTERPS